MSFVECNVDKDYEIYTEFPYEIRRKDNHRIISEYIDNKGYVCCCLNRKQYLKHRIVALQFIENDDIEHKTQVDHINRIRSDNRVENLRWITPSDNNRNKSSMNGHQYTFIDELPETAESLDSYNGHDLDGVFVDYEEQKLYLFNGIKYRELIPLRRRGNIRYRVTDIENKKVDLTHKVLFP